MLSNQWNDSRLHNYIRLQVEWTIHKTKSGGCCRERVGGNGRVIMYSTGLVGALVMTSSTLWPLITNVSTHDGPWVPLEFKLSTHRQTWVKLSLLLVQHFFSDSGPSQDPPFCPPTPAHHLPPWSAVTRWDCLWSDWDWADPAELWLPVVFKACVWNGPPLQGHTKCYTEQQFKGAICQSWPCRIHNQN